LADLPAPQHPPLQVAHPALEAPVLPVRQGAVQADAEDVAVGLLAQADLVADGAGELGDGLDARAKGLVDTQLGPTWPEVRSKKR